MGTQVHPRLPILILDAVCWKVIRPNIQPPIVSANRHGQVAVNKPWQDIQLAQAGLVFGIILLALGLLVCRGIVREVFGLFNPRSNGPTICNFLDSGQFGMDIPKGWGNGGAREADFGLADQIGIKQ